MTGLIIGFLLFALAWGLARLSMKRRSKQRREQRAANSPKSIKIDVATISRDLVPLIDKLEVANTTIHLVGGDGEYFLSSNGKYLESAMDRWVRAGAEVNYYLIAPSPEALACLDGLIAKHGDKFRVYRLDDCECSDRSTELTAFFETLHPTLIESESGVANAMWVEYNHPRKSRFAYSVKFTSPEALVDDEKVEFECYLGLVHELHELCSRYGEEPEGAPETQEAA